MPLNRNKPRRKQQTAGYSGANAFGKTDGASRFDPRMQRGGRGQNTYEDTGGGPYGESQGPIRDNFGAGPGQRRNPVTGALEADPNFRGGGGKGRPGQRLMQNVGNLMLGAGGYGGGQNTDAGAGSGNTGGVGPSVGRAQPQIRGIKKGGLSGWDTMSQKARQNKWRKAGGEEGGNLGAWGGMTASQKGTLKGAVGEGQVGGRQRQSMVSPTGIPNPGRVTSRQTDINRQAALDTQQLNMMNQKGPYGSLTYKRTGTNPDGSPKYTAVTKMSAGQERIRQQGQKADIEAGKIEKRQLGQIGRQFRDPFDLSSLGEMPTADEATRANVRESIIGRQSPQMEQNKQALENKLVNQGFVVGSEAFNNAMDEANRASSDMYLGADIQAGDEMQRAFQMGIQGRQQGVSEALTERNQPLSELSMFRGQTRPQEQRLINTPQGRISPADFTGSAYGSGQMLQNQIMQQQGAANASDLANQQGWWDLGGIGLQGAMGWDW